MKKVNLFTVAMATTLLASCGGNEKERTSDKIVFEEDNYVYADTLLDGCDTIPGYIPQVDETESAEEVSESPGVSDENVPYELKNVENFKHWAKVKEFKNNATSNNIDKMLDAYQWHEETQKAISDRVRVLERNAIAISMELDKLDREVAEDDDNAYTFSVMLEQKRIDKEMSASQEDRYWEIGSIFSYYFDMTKESELYSKYNDICMEIKFGF